MFRNRGAVSDFNAASLRAGGAGGVWSVEQTKGAFDTAAANTLTTGIGKAAFGLAAKYGGDWGGGGGRGVDCENASNRDPTPNVA